MKFINLAVITLLSLSAGSSFAQKSNAQNIVGCWVLKKMEFSNPDESSKALSDGAVKTVLCFDTKGKFTTQLPKAGSTLIYGTYTVSDDGKIIHQSREIQEEGIDDDVEILFLDEKHLNLRAEETTMYLERK